MGVATAGREAGAVVPLPAAAVVPLPAAAVVVEVGGVDEVGGAQRWQSRMDGLAHCRFHHALEVCFCEGVRGPLSRRRELRIHRQPRSPGPRLHLRARG